MTINKDKAKEFAEDFKTEAQRNAAEYGFREGQTFQLADDLECAALFIRRLCIQYKLADKPDPKLADMERKADEIVERFKREMQAI